jgi:ABC-type Fe3+ transport system permease subunit
VYSDLIKRERQNSRGLWNIYWGRAVGTVFVASWVKPILFSILAGFTLHWGRTGSFTFGSPTLDDLWIGLGSSGIFFVYFFACPFSFTEVRDRKELDK